MITHILMELHIVELSPHAPTMLEVSLVHVTLGLWPMYHGLDAGIKMSAQKVVTLVRQILTVGTGMDLIIVLAR